MAQTETKYNIDNTGLFYSGNDIFGSSRPFLSLNKEDFIVLPRTIPFEEVSSSISYEAADESQAAVISYSYQEVPLGTVRVDFNADSQEPSIFDMEGGEGAAAPDQNGGDDSVIFVNVRFLLIGAAVLAGLLLLWLIVHLILKNYNFSPRSGRRGWRKRNRHRRRGSRKHRGPDF